MTGAALIERCVADCIRVGVLDESDALLTSNQVDMPYAYVIYDHGRAERVARIRDWLTNFDILLAGPLQRMGVLQLGPCVHRRQEGGGSGAAPDDDACRGEERVSAAGPPQGARAPSAGSEAAKLQACGDRASVRRC